MSEEMTREQAIKVFENMKKGIMPFYPEQYCDMAIKALEQEPKTGHWIGVDEEPHEDWECDRCGHVEYANEDVPDEYHFCPNCGARMVEPQEEQG